MRCCFRLYSLAATFIFVALQPLASVPAQDGGAFAPPPGLQKYTFWPQGGNFWDDLYPTNLVDLDTGSGVLDYHSTVNTYDGHLGIDTAIETFSHMAIGVPIFSALDGVVVAAHDGEFDMNTDNPDKLANFVRLAHGGGHETLYLHMKKGSVAVTVGQSVKAGQQIGLTGSSGNSSAPHLHFESSCSGEIFEPFAGSARPGLSMWQTQPAFRSEFYVREFVLTSQPLANWLGLPIDTARTGTFHMGAAQTVNFWTYVHNVPAGATISARYLRPDSSVAFAADLGTVDTAFRTAIDPHEFAVDLNVEGEWHIEYSLNDRVVALAPFTVLAAGASATNRPPRPITVAFDPPDPTPGEVIFCRITSPQVFNDPDYDIVRYRYLWQINGRTVRDLVSAGFADAIPHDVGSVGDLVTCTVTPSDGKSDGATVVASARFKAPFGPRRAFFNGEVALAGSNFYYLQFANGTPFGYYTRDFGGSLDAVDRFVFYHNDLGFEYFFDAQDGQGGAYFYDFASGSFFYTSPTFPFPYLYDFNLNAFLYYFPDSTTPGLYTKNPRYFFNFSTNGIITK